MKQHKIELQLGYRTLYIGVNNEKEGLEYQKELPMTSVLRDPEDKEIYTLKIPYTPRNELNIARFAYMAHNQRIGTDGYKPLDDALYEWYSTTLRALNKSKFVLLVAREGHANTDLLGVLDVYYRLKNKYTEPRTPGLWIQNFREIIKEYERQKDEEPNNWRDPLQYYNITIDNPYNVAIDEVSATDENFYSYKKKSINIFQSIILRRAKANEKTTILSTNEGIASIALMLSSENFKAFMDHCTLRFVDFSKGIL